MEREACGWRASAGSAATPNRLQQGRMKAEALCSLPSVESVGREAQPQRARGAVRLHRQVSAGSPTPHGGRRHRTAAASTAAAAVSRRNGARPEVPPLPASGDAPSGRSISRLSLLLLLASAPYSKEADRFFFLPKKGSAFLRKHSNSRLTDKNFKV